MPNRRQVPGELETHLLDNGQHKFPLSFVRVGLTPPLLMHTGSGLIRVSGEDWLGLGIIRGIESIGEKIDLSATPAKIILSPERLTTRDFQDLLIAKTYRFKEVVLYTGFLNMATGTLHGDYLDEDDRYLISQITANEANVVVELESEDSEFGNSAGILGTDTVQQTMFPGDLAREYVEFFEDFNLSFSDGTTQEVGTRPDRGGGNPYRRPPGRGQRR